MPLAAGNYGPAVAERPEPVQSFSSKNPVRNRYRPKGRYHTVRRGGLGELLYFAGW
jgi:hypothetical protein